MRSCHPPRSLGIISVSVSRQLGTIGSAADWLAWQMESIPVSNWTISEMDPGAKQTSQDVPTFPKRFRDLGVYFMDALYMKSR